MAEVRRGEGREGGREGGGGEGQFRLHYSPTPPSFPPSLPPYLSPSPLLQNEEEVLVEGAEEGSHGAAEDVGEEAGGEGKEGEEWEWVDQVREGGGEGGRV